MYSIGQRWYSEGEPELGLGIITATEGKRIELHFPLNTESRIYSVQSSPLKRFSLQVEDKLTTSEGEEFLITGVEQTNDLFFYLSDDKIISEMDLSPKIDLAGPLQRVMAKNFDDSQFFDLRYQSYLHMRHYEAFAFKGFLGAKLRLIPHQVYVVAKVLEMSSPKVMLCDEVGLGKTIEAALILNSLVQKEIVSDILIVVPESLVNQWFIELYKKFSLSFQTLSEQTQDFDLETTQRLIMSSKILSENPDLAQKIKSKKWDMLIIDESHQFNFSRIDLAAIQFFQEINLHSFASILLSATPEVLGVENLFNQLHFLDPNKYTDFPSFSKMIKKSHEISKLLLGKDLLSEEKKFEKYFTCAEFKSFTSEEELKQTLIDRFGTGRSYFRNSRKNLENYSRLFNERILHAYPLKVETSINDKTVLIAKTNFVFDIIKTYADMKILILCHSKSVVLKLHEQLTLLGNFKLAVFHSEQSLLERDRQSAYFADEAGAQVLISTEIGSEGRNFEFSNHLILFDLPKLPDQLEQRIGRLDRIGQKNDINVHIPYILETFEEILFRWYNETFQSFTSSPKGVHAFYEKHQSALKALLETSFSSIEVDSFISKTSREYQLYKEELEQGRDLVIETHSYNDLIANKIINDIKDYEEKNSPSHYIDNICNAVGVNNEQLNNFVSFLSPSDNMLLPSFPGLKKEGISITFDREFSLKHENIDLLGWEHPIVRGSFELLLNSPLGNLSVIKQEALPRNIYFEFVISLQCADKFKHISALYLPYTPIRVLLNAQGENVTKKFPKKFIDEIGEKLGPHEDEILSGLPRDLLIKLFSQGHELAKGKSNKYIKDASMVFQTKIKHEFHRIEQLAIEANTKKSLQKELSAFEAQILESISQAMLSIDALRVILPKE